MCHTIGCACLGPVGYLAASSNGHGRFGLAAPLPSRTAVGSFIDRFRWPHPISHDWPTVLHNPLDISSWDARRDRHHLDLFEPHQDNIKSTLALRTASIDLTTHSYTGTNSDMEFSGKDLEDIQRVAGLLNLTVDELLQQSRTQTLDAAASVRSPFQSSPELDVIQQQPAYLNHQNSVTQHQTFLNLDSDAFSLGGPRSNASGSDPSSLSLPPPAQTPGTKLVLLNPHTTWYDCDAALWDFNQSVAGFTLNDTSNHGTDEGSGHPVSAMEIDSGSDHTARDKDQEVPMDDVSTDWLLLPSGSDSASSQTPVSVSTGSTDKRYHMISPRGPKSATISTSGSSSHRVQKKRSRYEGAKRIDTHLTRQLHACVRCRMQRNRVRNFPNPSSQAELSLVVLEGLKGKTRMSLG